MGDQTARGKAGMVGAGRKTPYIGTYKATHIGTATLGVEGVVATAQAGTTVRHRVGTDLSMVAVAVSMERPR